MFDRVKRTSFGVKSQDGLGKAYQVIHFYETGTSGLFESADPLGPGMTTISGNQAQLLALGTAASNIDIFPDAQEVPHTGEVKRTLSLHKVTGNYSVPVAWKQLDMLNSAQLKKVARDLKAVAKKKLLREASSFFSYEVLNDTSAYCHQVLGRISAIADHSVWTNYKVITLDEQYGRIANFAKGMRVDIVKNSSGTMCTGTAVNASDVANYDQSSAYVMMVVVDVDYLGKKITLFPIDTVDGTTPASASGWVGGTTFAGLADDWIVPAKYSRHATSSRPFFSWGINNWIKSSGSILGGADQASGLDLDLYSMFKSQVKAVNAPLTDDILNAYIAGYLDAYPGEELDTIITTQGVQQQWLKQPGLYNNRQNYERTGKSLSMMGGWSKVSYEFGGRVFEWIISPMCLSKTLYGLRFSGNNILRYGPPRIGGVEGQMGPELEFLGPLAGFNGVFMPVNSASTGRPLDILQAPFWYYELLCPTDPRGLKLTGLTESSLT
jgi:hypothetical protein